MWNLDPPPGFRGLDPDLPTTVYYRHLPHWRQEGATYFVTFHLGDALPQTQVRALREFRRAWLVRCPPPRSPQDWQLYVRQFTVKMERWIDAGHGRCYFKEPRHAATLNEALLRFQDRRYRLSCFVIMPNHCHLIVKPFASHALEKILQCWKGFVARRVQATTSSRGSIWQEESYDRIIRDEEHLYRVVQYIGNNPRTAGLDTNNSTLWLHPEWQNAGWRFTDPPNPTP